MIVRITFIGLVPSPTGKKKGYRDCIDVHVSSVDDAKKMFKKWLGHNSGIRGKSGVFHPLDGFGDIQLESVEERKE